MNKYGLLFIVGFAFLIRIIWLGSVPISLHGDEIGVGYNAYALLKSGIDEYGNSWPFVLRADVAPLIFYATIPAVKIFGLTEFATRLPSVVVGLLTIFIFYFLIKELFDQKVALLATLFFSLSPWHIQISRIAHDASYGLLLQLLATFCFLKGIKKKQFFLLLSFVFFGLSFYSYHSPRLTSPLLLFALLVLFRQTAVYMKKTILCGTILFALIITPITLDFVSKPIAETRIGGISIFTRADISIPLTPLYFIKTIPTFITNYFNQYNPYFLFINTSSMRYFNVRFVGLLYWWELPLLCIGLLTIVKKYKKIRMLIFLWLLIAVLPGSLTRGDPNAGRIFMLLPVFSILSGTGFITIAELLKKRRLIFYVSSLIILVGSVSYFLHQYFIDSPFRFSQQWGYGAKEIAQKVLAIESQYSKIIITSQIREGYIYILFYGKKDPLWLAQLSHKKRNSFIGYDTFGMYEFRPIDWQHDRYSNNTLVVGTSAEIPEKIPLLFEVKNINGETILSGVNTKNISLPK